MLGGRRFAGRRWRRLGGRDHRREVDARHRDDAVICGEILRGDRSHPIRAGAPAGHRGRARLLEVLVVAGDVAVVPLAEVLRLAGEIVARALVDAQRAHRDVAAQVGVVLAAAEPACALASCPHDLVRHRAQVVLRLGVAFAEAEARQVVGVDVRDAVGGAHDARGVGVGSAVAARGGEQCGGQEPAGGAAPGMDEGEVGTARTLDHGQAPREARLPGSGRYHAGAWELSADDDRAV
jgi:hypothetical protein